MFSNLHLKSFIRVIVKLKWLFTAFCSKYHPMSVGRKHERETRKKLSRKGRRKKVLGSNGTLKNKIFIKGAKKQESPCGLLIALRERGKMVFEPSYRQTPALKKEPVFFRMLNNLSLLSVRYFLCTWDCWSSEGWSFRAAKEGQYCHKTAGCAILKCQNLNLRFSG
jgi:hypothetical protein